MFEKKGRHHTFHGELIVFNLYLVFAFRLQVRLKHQMVVMEGEGGSGLGVQFPKNQ